MPDTQRVGKLINYMIIHFNKDVFECIWPKMIENENASQIYNECERSQGPRVHCNRQYYGYVPAAPKSRF